MAEEEYGLRFGSDEGFESGPAGKYIVVPTGIGVLEANAETGRAEMGKVMYKEAENSRELPQFIPVDGAQAYDRLHPVLPTVPLAAFEKACSRGTAGLTGFLETAFQEHYDSKRTLFGNVWSDRVNHFSAPPGTHIGTLYGFGTAEREVYDPAADMMMNRRVPCWFLSDKVDRKTGERIQRVTIHLSTLDSTDGSAVGGLRTSFSMRYKWDARYGVKTIQEADGSSREIQAPERDVFGWSSPSPYLIRVLIKLGLVVEPGVEGSLAEELKTHKDRHGCFYSRFNAEGNRLEGYFEDVANVMPELSALMWRQGPAVVQWDVQAWNPQDPDHDKHPSWRLGLILDEYMPTISKVAPQVVSTVKYPPTWNDFVTFRAGQEVQVSTGAVAAAADPEDAAWQLLRAGFGEVVNEFASMMAGKEVVAVVGPGAPPDKVGQITNDGMVVAKLILLPIVREYKEKLLIDPEQKKVLPLSPKRWKEDGVDTLLMVLNNLLEEYVGGDQHFSDDPEETEPLLAWVKENWGEAFAKLGSAEAEPEEEIETVDLM